MSKSKYETHIEPYIDKIASWAEQGATSKEIAAKLGIAACTLRKYISEGEAGDERYTRLASSFARACEVPDDAVEAALYRRACGYQYEETTVEDKVTKTGEIVTVHKTVKRDIPPDPTSAMFWLTNRRPERWQYKPQPKQEDNGGETGVVELPAAAEEPQPPSNILGLDGAENQADGDQRDERGMVDGR